MHCVQTNANVTWYIRPEVILALHFRYSEPVTLDHLQVMYQSQTENLQLFSLLDQEVVLSMNYHFVHQEALTSPLDFCLH